MGHEALGALQRAEAELEVVVALDEAIEHPNLASDRAALERIQAERKAGAINDKTLVAIFIVKLPGNSELPGASQPSSSPEHRDCILNKRGIIADQRSSFNNGLGDQQTIKGILMPYR